MAPSPPHQEEAPTADDGGGSGGGLPITVLDPNGRFVTVGTAPPAPLPRFLRAPAITRHQADLGPTSWSLTIAQWLRFVQACMDTPTWRALAKAKGGEELISMCDINTNPTIHLFWDPPCIPT